MIVKTKGGDYNTKTNINVLFENSFNFLDKFPEFVDGARYMEMHNMARRSRNQNTIYSEKDIAYTLRPEPLPLSRRRLDRRDIQRTWPCASAPMSTCQAAEAR